MMMTYPAELLLLAILMIFAASLWIPYIVGITKEPGGDTAFDRPADLHQMRAWVHRAHRAHLNLLEQGMPFAVLVLLTDRVDGFSALTLWASVMFLVVRVLHALGMISGLAKMPLRPILFNIGWGCVLVMGYAAVRAMV
jgi:uncharacterized MAPEG superfamily protein